MTEILRRILRKIVLYNIKHGKFFALVKWLVLIMFFKVKIIIDKKLIFKKLKIESEK